MNQMKAPMHSDTEHFGTIKSINVNKLFIILLEVRKFRTARVETERKKICNCIKTLILSAAERIFCICTLIH